MTPDNQGLSTEDHDLVYTQQMRRRLISQMLKKGTVPEDPKEAKVFLAALDGMDRQTLTKKKIASDEGLGNQQVAAAAIIAQMLNDPRSKNFSLTIVPEVPREPSAIELDASLVPSKLVPGELDP